jgi:hypothetical protein
MQCPSGKSSIGKALKGFLNIKTLYTHPRGFPFFMLLTILMLLMLPLDSNSLLKNEAWSNFVLAFSQVKGTETAHYDAAFFIERNFVTTFEY